MPESETETFRFSKRWSGVVSDAIRIREKRLATLKWCNCAYECLIFD